MPVGKENNDEERVLVMALDYLDDLQERITSVEGTYEDLVPELMYLDINITESVWPIMCMSNLGRLPTEMPNLKEMTDNGEKLKHTPFTEMMVNMSDLLVDSFTEMWDDEDPDRIIHFEESKRVLKDIRWARLLIKSFNYDDLHSQ